MFDMFWIVLGLLVLTAESRIGPRRPHIVFILVDDVGWNDFSFHGSDQIPTPNIDALAYSGIILNQHYVQPICTPTRAALLTGRYPSNIGMQGIPIVGAEPRALPRGKLLPQYLKDLGYKTRIVGKWHLGFYKKEFTPTYRGFDSHLGFWNGLVNYYDHVYQDLIPANSSNVPLGNCTSGGQPRIFQDWTGGTQLSGVDFYRNMRPALDLYGRYATDVFTDEAVRIIDNHDRSSPLFLYLSHLACHAGNIGKLLEAPKDAINKFGHIIEPNRKTYAAMVWMLDKSVGKVVAALGKRGMLKNTRIVLLSDNGAPTLNVGAWRNWGSNHPLRGVKGTQWEGGVRGVGVMWSYGLKPRVSTQLMHVADWLPTLYTAAGGNPADLKAAKLDGVDQWNALVYNKPSRRDSALLYIEEVRNVTAVRRGRWKLVSGNNGKLDGYSGASVLSSKNPPYRPKAVLQSLAGMALATVNAPLTAANILKLRKQATVTCSTSANNTNCDIFRGSCLFDLSVDPCEMNDLSTEQPGLMQELSELLKKYTTTLVPQLNQPPNPARADPARFNNIWSPWDE